MPIRINLLAEILAEEELRRKDPVKRSIYVGLFLIAITVAWWSSMWAEQVVSNSKLGAIQIQANSYTNSFQTVQSSKKLYEEAQKRLQSLEQLSSARFLNGNLLNAIQKLYVPNVQVSRLRLEMSYSFSSGTPSKTNQFGIVRGAAPSSTETTLLTIDAKDFTPGQGDKINDYINAVTAQEYFRANLIPANGVKLLDQRFQQSSMSGKPYTTFTIACRFLDKTR